MERNLKLDYFKIILSLLVITVHSQPLFSEGSLAGWLISNGIARVAVPCFFIISGYYIHSKLEDIKLLKKYLLHLFVVYITWSLIYFPVYYSTIESRSLITFALMGYYHLWFLPALIVAILLLAVSKRFIKKDNLILYSGIILFLIGYIMENSGLPYRTFCNGLFFGYPLVSLGYFIYRKDIQLKIKNYILYPILIISTLTLLLESFLGYKENVYHNLFISFYFISPALVLWALKSNKKSNTNAYVSQLAAVIYYIHIFVLTLIIPLTETFNINKLPFIAFISILLAIFITFINKRIKIFL